MSPRRRPAPGLPVHIVVLAGVAAVLLGCAWVAALAWARLRIAA